MESKTEIHPVTPGGIIPASELLGDLLLQMNQPAQALEAYVANLIKHPYRFNGLYGTGMAAKKSCTLVKALYYYRKLLTVAGANNPYRPELLAVRAFLKKHG